MKLLQLLQPWLESAEMTGPSNQAEGLRGSSLMTADLDITGLQNDSRHIKSGDLFIAYPGALADGRHYMQQAVLAGAVAIIYEPNHFPVTHPVPSQVPCIAIPKLAQQLSTLASRFYGQPTRDITFTGVTGTNGKTTIAYQLAQAHQLLGQNAAYIGTLGQGNVLALQPLANTTPDGLCLQQLFYQYRQQQIQQVCMEVSSHALSQQRVDAIDFNQAIFTNLTHDHLDYHQTMEAYAAAKALLFAMPSLRYAIVNRDDDYSSHMLAQCGSQCQAITYGLQTKGDVRACNWQMTMTGSTFEVQTPWGQGEVYINTLGAFNIYNSLAVLTSLLAQGYSLDVVRRLMPQLQAAPGRMEVVLQKPCVVVDYAHTPDALDNVLRTLQQLRTEHARLWVVFGCGGDRDKTKRPIMGKIASLYADEMIITSDNPRSEDPEQIMQDIALGIGDHKKVHQIVERREAILSALNGAAPQDIVLIAGKGHENYQQIGQQRLPFSDQLIVQNCDKKEEK